MLSGGKCATLVQNSEFLRGKHAKHGAWGGPFCWVVIHLQKPRFSASCPCYCFAFLSCSQALETLGVVSIKAGGFCVPATWSPGPPPPPCSRQPRAPGRSQVSSTWRGASPLVARSPVPTASGKCSLAPTLDPLPLKRAGGIKHSPSSQQRGCHSPERALTRRTGASRGWHSVAGWASPPGTPAASCRRAGAGRGCAAQAVWGSLCSWRRPRGCWSPHYRSQSVWRPENHLLLGVEPAKSWPSGGWGRGNKREDTSAKVQALTPGTY